jgi:O-antigen/teichoic acid export membrane protein
VRRRKARRTGSFKVALTDSQPSDRVSRMRIAGLIARLRAWLDDSSDRSIAQRVAGTAFLIRVASAALVYLSQIFLARWMGSFEFGIYVYVWTWVLLIGDLSDLGLSSSAQRFIPEYTKRKAYDLLRGFVTGSRWLAFGSTATIAAIGALAVKLLEPWLPGYVVVPLLIACVTLPFYTLLQVQDGIARSYNWINVALLPPYILRHVTMLALVAAAFAFDFPTTAETAVIAVGVALALTAIGQTVALNRKLKTAIEPGPKSHAVRTWYAFSIPILLVEGFYLFLSHTDILVLQHFRGPEDVAMYYAAAKTLALVAFVHFAISAAVAHRFSEYHIANDQARLTAILADSIRWTFWASLAAMVLILAMGKPLLWLFGPRYVDGYHLMFILAIGLMARASVGPVERLLNMLGQQRICAAVYATAFALNLVLCIALVPRLGGAGAAISTATAIVVEAILLFVAARRRLGMHAFIWGAR